MWWPSQLLKSNNASPSSEASQTSFFKLADDIKDKPKHTEKFRQISHHSLSIEDEQASLSAGLLCNKPFVMQMPSINKRKPKKASAKKADSDQEVLIIGRTASFEKSLSRERRPAPIKAAAVLRRSLSKKGSAQSVRQSPVYRKNQTAYPSPKERIFVTDLVNPKEEDYFMLDLDEAWHPDGYSLKDHTEFLIDLEGKVEKKWGGDAFARPVSTRRPVAKAQREARVSKETFPVSPTDGGEDEAPAAFPTAPVDKPRVITTVSVDMSEITKDTGRPLSGASTPGSAMLSFSGKNRRGSKGSDRESFRPFIPEDTIDFSDVFVHLGPLPPFEGQYKAGGEDNVASKKPVPRSSSMSSIPSQSTKSSFLSEHRKRHSTIDLAHLPTPVEDDDGWFKLAKKDSESWADFSQSLNRKKGAEFWQKLEGGERVPLPEPTFVGVSPHRQKSRASSFATSALHERFLPRLAEAGGEGPRSLSPMSHSIAYSPSLERLTSGALPFLYETLQESPFGGRESPAPGAGGMQDRKDGASARSRQPTGCHPFATQSSTADSPKRFNVTSPVGHPFGDRSPNRNHRSNRS